MERRPDLKVYAVPEDVIYLRKSQADMDMEKIAEMETLERHKKHLLGVAERQNLNVTKIYKEIVSGDMIQDRPEFIKLLNDIRQKKYRSVIVMEVQRLGRGDAKDQGTIFEALRMTGTLVVTPDKTYNPNDEADAEYLEFALFMSRREYKFITKRMQRGRIDAVKEGQFIGTVPPYGYETIRYDKKHKTLKIIPEQAETVKKMFMWMYEDKCSYGEIRRRLIALGIPSPQGKPEWHNSTIKDLLSNHVYIGKIRWYRRKQSKEFEGATIVKVNRRQEEKDMLIVTGQHEGFIDVEVFYKVQEIIKGYYRPPVNFNKITNPLAGIVKCSKCGGSMKKQSFPNKKNVRSRMYHDSARVCQQKSTYFDDCYESVIQSLKAHLSDFEIELKEKDTENEEKKYELKKAKLQMELKQLEARKKRIKLAFEKGMYDLEEASESKAEVTDLMLSIQEELMSLHPPDKEELEEKIVTFQQVIDSLLNEDISPSVKNELIKGIVERIEYTNDGETVHLEVFLRE